MSDAEFLSDPESLLAAFASLCDWAEEIIVCTPRIDDGDGLRALTRSIGKVRLCMVSERAPGLDALAPLQARGALRLVEGRGSRFGPNVYLFRRGAEARALVGTARLTREGVGSGIESVMRVEGTRDDPFACALADFVEVCLARSRLPPPSDLDPDGPAPECEPFAEIADEDERATLVWQQLLGSGVLTKDEAVRLASHRLREGGLADFRRLHSAGPFYQAVLGAIERGVRLGLLDRPSRGLVRAVLAEARDYPDWLWQACVLARVSDRVFVTREEAVRSAAAWAVENVGLRHRNLRTGGRVDEGLRRALTRAILQGDVLNQGHDLVRRADGT